MTWVKSYYKQKNISTINKLCSPGGGANGTLCVSCGSTFVLNVSVLCQLTIRELSCLRKFVVMIPALLVEFYPGSCADRNWPN